MGMPQGSGGLIMEFPSPSTKQWNYLTHSWELGLQTPGHIYAPVGHACRTSRDLVSSELLWFCLEPRSIQLPSSTSRRFPYLGHIGLTVWEAIIGEKGLRKVYALGSHFHNNLLSNGGAKIECDKHTHTVRINSYFGRQIAYYLFNSVIGCNYPLANEVARGYSNATFRPSVCHNPCEHS